MFCIKGNFFIIYSVDDAPLNGKSKIQMDILKFFYIEGLCLETPGNSLNRREQRENVWATET